jgi:amidase
MNSSDFKPTFATAAETANAVRNKRISATELLNFELQRIDRYNPKLNAIVWQSREHALARAKQADAALVAGKTPGALQRAGYHQRIVRLSRVAQHLGFASA